MTKVSHYKKLISVQQNLSDGRKAKGSETPLSVVEVFLHASQYQKRKDYYKKRYQLNKVRLADLQRDYHKRNKVIIALKRKKYRESRKEIDKIYKREYILKNKDKILQKNRLYYQKNKERILIRNRLYQGKRVLKYHKNINFRLAHSLRVRIKNVLKGKIKSGSAVRDLGCTIPELKIHLEKQFKEGMNWKNWGRLGKGKVWQIDHIRPLSLFNLSNFQEFEIANHYTNLQPLWADENREKSNKII